MEKDIQALQQGGGEIQPPALPEEPVPPAPAEQGFLQQDTVPMPDAQVPTGPPPPPPIAAEPVAPSIPPAPGEPSPKKTGALKHLLLALGGIAGLLTLGALGYFVALPAVQRAFAPVLPPPTPVITPTPIPAAEEPTPTPPAPTPPLVQTITLAVPVDETLNINLAIATTTELIAELQRVAATPSQVGAFKEVRASSNERQLSSQEMFSLLFASSPREIRAGLTDAYAIFLYWVDADTARLGAYFALNPAALEAAKAAALGWEAVLAQDANAFFLGVEPGEVTVAFRDGEYQNIPLRFTVFERGMSIGYALTNNTFLYSTGGRDPMFEALRRLTGR
jgi:hypothetical protein